MSAYCSMSWQDLVIQASWHALLPLAGSMSSVRRQKYDIDRPAASNIVLLTLGWTAFRFAGSGLTRFLRVRCRPTRTRPKHITALWDTIWDANLASQASLYFFLSFYRSILSRDDGSYNCSTVAVLDTDRPDQSRFSVISLTAAENKRWDGVWSTSRSLGKARRRQPKSKCMTMPSMGSISSTLLKIRPNNGCMPNTLKYSAVWCFFLSSFFSSAAIHKVDH